MVAHLFSHIPSSAHLRSARHEEKPHWLRPKEQVQAKAPSADLLPVLPKKLVKGKSPVITLPIFPALQAAGLLSSNPPRVRRDLLDRVFPVRNASPLLRN